MGIAIFANNATSLLAATITAGQATLAITSGDEAKFPTPTGGDWFPITVVDGSGNIEIMYCTARSGVTLTVTRARENTTAFAFQAGARVDIRPTAGSFNDLFSNPERLDVAANILSILQAADFAAVRVLLSVYTQAEVTALINAVIEGAPGQLDTLNELAAALGDDANFAATMAAALAGKEPADVTILKSATAAALSAAFEEAVDDDGTQSSGTYTPSLAAGSNTKKIVNGGAFQIDNVAPTANDRAAYVTLWIVNNASAGAITINANINKTGDDFDVDNGSVFECRQSTVNIGGTHYRNMDVVKHT